MTEENYQKMESDYMAGEHERIKEMRGCIGSTVIAIIIITAIITLIVL